MASVRNFMIPPICVWAFRMTKAISGLWGFNCKPPVLSWLGSHASCFGNGILRLEDCHFFSQKFARCCLKKWTPYQNMKQSVNMETAAPNIPFPSPFHRLKSTQLQSKQTAPTHGVRAASHWAWKCCGQMETWVPLKITKREPNGETHQFPKAKVIRLVVPVQTDMNCFRLIFSEDLDSNDSETWVPTTPSVIFD